MSNLRRVLERQEREEEEIRCRRAEEDHELDEDEEEMVVVQARWAIITGAACMLNEEVLGSVIMTYIIIHNKIVEDEYDYDAPEVFEPDPMNTTLTRIYEKPMRANRQSMEHEPLIRDGRYNNPMIDRY
ncbi:unnamed protein product [Prunus brigantina]